jgi:hypothetical protein
VSQACPLPDDKIVIYGGEDSHRRPLAEAYVLDLQEFTWSKLAITSKQQPTARSGHVATLISNLLVVFGGELTREVQPGDVKGVRVCALRLLGLTCVVGFVCR